MHKHFFLLYNGLKKFAKIKGKGGRENFILLILEFILYIIVVSKGDECAARIFFLIFAINFSNQIN